MLLETRTLNIGYGDIQVLWDIHLRIDEGEIVALAGSNGAGKTTLLKGLMGVLKPISGEILFEDKNISCLAALPSGPAGHLPGPGRQGTLLLDGG